MSNKWLNNTVQHLIYQLPAPLNIKKVKRKTFKNNQYTSKNILYESYDHRHGYLGMAGFFAVFSLLFFFYVEDYPVLGGGGALLIAFLITLYGYTIPKKQFVYNRLEGLITIPPTFYGKHVTCLFKDIKVWWFGQGGASGALRVDIRIAPPNRNAGVLVDMHDLDYVKNWSFIVWYMDKNRPLPLGEVFDPYRQEDFERRKKEGFPTPLYLSQIHTPEATPAQQKEREKYWKDEDYFGKTTSAWF